jgi:2-polyprenyl-6-methoxyphenol hydroxylase-like FAD-dependent oxidoreductase
MAGRAVVLGASMAGLMAARVLSERFQEVWLLDRDPLPQGAMPRKGTPHALHTHGLLARGLHILEALFPGMSVELERQGAVFGDFCRDGIFQVGTRRFAAADANLRVVAVTRLTLEAEVRRRVLALPNVKLCERIDVTGLAMSEDLSAVSGVRLTQRDAQGEPASQQTISADLVIDATGRASRTPRWLAAHGYTEPREERVGEGMPMNYVTLQLERPLDQPHEMMMAVCGTSPELPRGFVMAAQEPDEQGRGRWAITFGGYGDDVPPPDLGALRERARLHNCPEVTRVLAKARLLGEPLRYQFAYSRRLHYDKLGRFPSRYLVIGDAMASFNPVYGQGMTVAAEEALALRDAVASGLDRQLRRRFFAQAAALIDVAWETAVATDLALDFIPGERTRRIRLRNAFWAHTVVAAQHDPVVAMKMLRVGHFMAHPNTTASLGMIARVLWSRRKGDPPGRGIHHPLHQHETQQQGT